MTCANGAPAGPHIFFNKAVRDQNLSIFVCIISMDIANNPSRSSWLDSVSQEASVKEGASCEIVEKL